MSTMDEFKARLAEDDGSLPQRWNAEDVPNTSLVGTLLRFDTIVTSQGEGTIAVIEDADDGTLWGVALFRSVLRKRFETLNPKPGDVLGIKYIGLVQPQSKDARPYHNYVMKVIRGEGSSSLAPDVKVEQANELPF